MNMSVNDMVLVASRYRVAAFRKADGKPLWETVLVEGFFKLGAAFVTLALDETGIYAHVGNQLFRLELMTGKILWKQEVPNLGRDVASLAVGGGTTSATSAAFAKYDQERKSDSDGNT